ncbi:site-specific integrase [Salinibacterium sp. ZJ454]|uniref:tyrosine-type recombinase/integrase n=1 Tax=Salinibacterium sp. ZJ454 TaxID=2708339 RepID=UPI00141F2CD3|nr:site-specific integrase [Salinibacterium sp. ZJ454]
MGRPAIPLGGWGKVSAKLKSAPGVTPELWEATANYRDAYSGKRREVSATSNTEHKAETELNAKLRALAQEGPVRGTTKLHPGVTVAELAQQWEKWLYEESTLAVQSRDRYRRSGSYITGQFKDVDGLGSLKLRQLTRGRLTNHIMAVGAHSVPEAKSLRAAWSSMLAYALRFDAVPQNFAHGAIGKGQLVNTKKKKPRALTPDEAEKLFDLLDAAAADLNKPGPRSRVGLRNLIDVLTVQLACGGLRVHEAAAIHAEDVTENPDGSVIVRVHRGVVQKEGHGKKLAHGWEHPGKWLVQPHTKTRSVRLVRVDRIGAEVLRRRIAETRHADGLLFYSRTTHEPLNLANLRRTMRGVLGDTDLEWASTHTMRRSVGTMVKNAHGIEAASRALGHGQISTTQAGYIDDGNTAPDHTDLTEMMHGRRSA